MSIVIGLTGPTGAGKSTLTGVAEDLGFKVVDCDKVARDAVKPETLGLKALCSAFGEDILNPDGTLNRKALAEKAFISSEKTELLNRTILPFIEKLVMEEINTEKVLLDAPTLFESGIDSVCDVTVAVLSDHKIRCERILARDNITKDAALLRISAGKPDGYYKDRANIIIYNNEGTGVFKEEFKRILNNISKER